MPNVPLSAPSAAVPVAQKALEPARRVKYFDALRVLAAFLVIVNHTNSYVFQAADPSGLTWYLSIAWYYVSKMAVPLFVMVSGALLLPKQDSYRRVLGRFLRMVAVLVLFSYVYYLVELAYTQWSWQQALNLPQILGRVWARRMTDSFWYLYFFLGLMVMLPLLQRLASATSQRDIRYLCLVSFGVNGLWPLLVHYVPQMKLPAYFDLPLFSVFIGLFFAGHYLHRYAKPKPWHGWASLALILCSVLLSVALTRLEYSRVPPGAKYWFMDERTAPSLTILLCALGTFYLARCLAQSRAHREKTLARLPLRGMEALAKGSFCIYLLQDLLIAETRYRLFVPLCSVMNPFLAALVWEVGVFVLAAGLAWLLLRVPGLKKLL